MLEAQTQGGEAIARTDLGRTLSIIRRRLRKLGVKAIVQPGERNRIIVQFPGLAVPPEDRYLLTKPGKLEFFDLESDLTGPSISPQGFPIGTPTRLVARRGTVVLHCDPTDRFCPGVLEAPPTRIYYYLVRYQPNDAVHPIPEMTGADLELSGIRRDVDVQTGVPEVLLAFTDASRKKFREITKAEAVRGRTQYGRFGRSQGADPNNFNQHFAIVLDRDIKTFPSIDFNVYPNGIDPVNGARITGLRSAKEARDLTLVLQTGALPVQLVEVQPPETPN